MTRILSTYFLVLPFLFAAHSFDHKAEGHDLSTNEGIELHATLDDSDCELCVVYQNQASIVEDHSISFDAELFYSYNVCGSDSEDVLTLDHPYLRGPPLV